MKDRLKNPMKAAIVVAALFLVLVPALAQKADSGKAAAAKGNTQTFTGEIWDSVNAQRGSRDQMMKEHDLKTPLETTLFAVHYMNPPAKYVLYEPATKKIYQLDDQDSVQPYAAEKVRVTGTYDEATHTIHVTDIESASDAAK